MAQISVKYDGVVGGDKVYQDMITATSSSRIECECGFKPKYISVAWRGSVGQQVSESIDGGVYSTFIYNGVSYVRSKETENSEFEINNNGFVFKRGTSDIVVSHKCIVVAVG